MLGPFNSYAAVRGPGRLIVVEADVSQDLLLEDLTGHIEYGLKSVSTPDESPLHHFVYETLTRAEEAGVCLAGLSADFDRFVQAGAERSLPFLDLLISNVAGHLSPPDGGDRSVMRNAFRDRFLREIEIARKLGVPEAELARRIARIGEIVGPS